MLALELLRSALGAWKRKIYNSSTTRSSGSSTLNSTSLRLVLLGLAWLRTLTWLTLSLLRAWTLRR